MMSIHKLLILTDHTHHTVNNSFYTLAEAFVQHNQIEKVDVCSRGILMNSDFFEGKSNTFHVKSYETGQGFESMQGEWQNELFESNLQTYDFLLLRIPRPVSVQLFEYLEDNFDPDRIVNRPSGIKKTGSKEFLLQFPELCAPMSLVKSPAEALHLSKEMDLVLKPLEDYGGKGLLKIKGSQLWQGNEEIDQNRLSDYFDHDNGMLAMKYLSKVVKGDKRIVVADGKIMLSTIRYPSRNSWLCNIAQGGSAKMAQPSPNERKIARHISPILKDYGVILYGFDTLVNDNGKRVLSEINTLSIGGIGPAEMESGRKIAPVIAHRIINHLNRIVT